MTTVKELQLKILDKIELKHKSGVKKHTLESIFGNADKNRDGLLSLNDFATALEMQCSNALSKPELNFVFEFWDTMAGQRDASGFIEVDLVVQDLLASMPTYGTGFNSGDEGIKANKGAKGNLPSQSGGIFGGGAYSADAAGESISHRALNPVQQSQPLPAAQGVRPKGNQSSIPGGIFGADESAAPTPTQNNRSNRSNQSSIQGGIFGEAPAPAPKQYQGRNSNQSSIPGGIFG